jgi:tetratricopeptide (TPR) repeat protein
MTLVGRIAGLGFWAAVVGVVAANAWKAWDDRPTEPLKAVEGWAARGRAAEAERELRRILRRSPHDGAARMALARRLAAREDYFGCARELHRVPEWWPAKADALFLEGQAWKRCDRMKDAQGAWEALVADDPLHPVSPQYYSGAARELIALHVVRTRIDQARRVLWDAYKAAAPYERPDVLVMRIRVELERVAHEEAVAKLRRFVAADPTDWESRRALAVEEQLAGRPDEAERQVAACLRARPDDPWVWRSRLEVDHLRGDRDAVRADLKRLPPACDSDPEIWKYRGLARLWDKDPSAAAVAFRRALELDPTEAEYPYQLAMAAQRLGRRDAAAAALRRSRQLRDDYNKLQDAYHAYLKVAQTEAADSPPRRAAAERMAALCDRLGWPREAEALRQAHSGG